MSKKRSDRDLRQMPIFSGGRARTIIVDEQVATEVGRYMSAVGRLVETNDISAVDEFEGESIVDVNGKRYPFETRPNVLYGLTATEPDIMDQIYRILR
jgi:hypothetical protein